MLLTREGVPSTGPWDFVHPRVRPEPAPEQSLLSRGSREPAPPTLSPTQQSQPLTAASALGSPASPSLCSVFCNCVLTPRESSQELARLEAVTRAYRVRPRSPLPLGEHASPEHPGQGAHGREGAIQGLRGAIPFGAPASAHLAEVSCLSGVLPKESGQRSPRGPAVCPWRLKPVIQLEEGSSPRCPRGTPLPPLRPRGPVALPLPPPPPQQTGYL